MLLVATSCRHQLWEASFILIYALQETNQLCITRLLWHAWASLASNVCCDPSRGNCSTEALDKEHTMWWMIICQQHKCVFIVCHYALLALLHLLECCSARMEHPPHLCWLHTQIILEEKRQRQPRQTQDALDKVHCTTDKVCRQKLMACSVNRGCWQWRVQYPTPSSHAGHSLASCCSRNTD